jgi:hypothetical protein
MGGLYKVYENLHWYSQKITIRTMCRTYPSMNNWDLLYISCLQSDLYVQRS